MSGETSDLRVAIPGSPDTIVIGDFEGRAVQYANLRRISPPGSEVWRAAPPDGVGDWWVSARVERDEVTRIRGPGLSCD